MHLFDQIKIGLWGFFAVQEHEFFGFKHPLDHAKTIRLFRVARPRIVVDTALMRDK